VSRIELGAVGAVVGAGRGHDLVDTAVQLEAMGYPTIWLTGGPLTALDQIAAVVRATQGARIASGIISVDRFPADDVSALYAELEASEPGRFVVGLGGAHGANPLATLGDYLDRLDSQPSAVPQTARVMAALGPRMLDLARERASGAFPVLVTPEYTARARARLGDDTTLAVEQLVVLETEARRARELARGRLDFLASLPAYQASFRRMGFTDEDITPVADRLVDGVVAWGDIERVAAHIGAQQQSGADHVAIGVIAATDAPPVDQWRELATRLIGP
jgi:probable F420-dependent oxidoreductase